MDNSTKKIVAFAAGFVVIALRLSVCFAYDPIATYPNAESPDYFYWGPPGPQTLNIDPNDPYIQELACWTVAEMDSAFNKPFQSRPVQVISATQIMDKFTLNMTVGVTSCPKGENCVDPAMLCATSAKLCQVRVADGWWMDQKYLIEHSCDCLSLADLECTVT